MSRPHRLILPALLLVLGNTCPSRSTVDYTPICDPDRLPRPTYLWQVELPGGAQSHIFGTIHIDYDDVWPYTPRQARDAFDRADEYMFELNVLDPALPHRLLQSCGVLSDDGAAEALREPLHSDVERLWSRYWLGTFGSEMLIAGGSSWRTAWANRSPVWTAEQLLKLYVMYERKKARDNLEELLRRSESSAAAVASAVISATAAADDDTEPPPPQFNFMDARLMFRAQRRGKALHEAETIGEQCDWSYRTVQMDVQIALLRNVVDYLEGNASALEQDSSSIDVDQYLTDWYKCGAITEERFQGLCADKLVNSTRGADKQSVANSIAAYCVNGVARRNAKMAAAIDKLIRADPFKRYFIALGVGHLLGDRSVQALLEQRGYFIKRVGENHVGSYPIVSASAFGFGLSSSAASGSTAAHVLLLGLISASRFI